MARLMLNEIAQATKGQIVIGSGTLTVDSLSIDSRTLVPGALFFAIRGPKFNGHDFVLDAYQKGACGAVVSERTDLFKGYPQRALLQVPDTTKALQDVAHYVRNKWSGTLIGITGSTGKTTTKDFIAEVLEGKFSTFKSLGNLNNLYGLPLLLSRLEDRHEVAVFEMGMNHRGEIARLCEIANPVIGVYTNIAPVHMEFFNSLEEIAEAKAELLEGVTESGAIIYNHDDPLLKKLVQRFKGEKLSYGLEEAQVRALKVDPLGLEKTRFEIAYRGQIVKTEIPLIGRHNVYNALAAAGTALYLGMNLQDVADRLKRVRPAAMRGEIINFEEGFTLIDDSYNSNPTALKEMVSTIDGLAGFNRKILVAGEMLELGAKSGEFHKDCGRFIARSSVDLLICIQGHAKGIGEGAILDKFDESAVYFFPEAESASHLLGQIIRPGDLVLVKGSRGVHTERVVSILKERFHAR